MTVGNPRPIQQPAPPIYMAAYAPAALNRVARLADGWMPAGVPLVAIEPMMGQMDPSKMGGGDKGLVALLTFLASGGK